MATSLRHRPEGLQTEHVGDGYTSRSDGGEPSRPLHQGQAGLRDRYRDVVQKWGALDAGEYIQIHHATFRALVEGVEEQARAPSKSYKGFPRCV